MTKRVGTLVVLAPLLLLSVGCEDWCRQNYDLIKRTECKPQQPGQPPGPIIIFEPDDTQTTMHVTVAGQPEEPDTSTSIYEDPCYLRGDFIGVGLIDFFFYPVKEGEPLSASHVTVASDDHVIEIRRTAYNTIDWTIRTKGSGTPQVCDPMPKEAGAVLPLEFAGLQTATLKDVDRGINGEKVEIRVKLPGAP
jgi:hypothetical protein